MKVKTRFFAATGIVAGTAIVGAGVTIFVLTRDNSKTSKNVNLKELVITRNGDTEQEFDLQTLIRINLNKPNRLTDEEFKKISDNYNSYPGNTDDLIIEKTVGSGSTAQHYREYIDNYTGIKFRDFSYYTDPVTNERRYYLGKNGLVLLAFEFRRKVTFGPEIETLDSINVNNFNVIDRTANGIYIPSLRQIHINTFSAIESGLDLLSKVKLMMGTLFHEYTHHWASVYAEIGDNMAGSNRSFNLFTQNRNPDTFKNSPYTTPIRYYGTSTSTSSNDGYWSSFFVNNLYKLLNYDTKFTIKEAIEGSFDPEILNGNFERERELERFNNYKNFAFNFFSLNDIFRYANSSRESYPLQSNTFRELLLKFEEHSRVNFTNFGGFSTTQPGISKETIRYLYSVTELVPREWSKFAYTPYFDPEDVVRYVQNPSSRGQSWALSWGGFYKNEGRGASTFIPSSLGDDWSKVYLTNLAGIQVGGSIGPYFLENKNVVFPNKIGSLKGSVWENFWNQNGQSKKSSDRSKEFFKTFLDTMGYGKTIAQIIPNIKQPSIERTLTAGGFDRQSQNEVKLVGYLPRDTQYKGLVFQNNSGSSEEFQVAEFKFKDVFDYFKGERLNLENELTNGLEFKNYITKNYINFSLVDTNKTIKYWQDKNNDGKFTPDEIISGTMTLPKSRYTTTLNSSNKDFRTSTTFKWYTLQETTTGVKILVRKFT